MRRTADDRRAARQRGVEAEAFVADQYLDLGWEIIARNLRIGGAELDIVAHRDGELRFVEVKARDPSDPNDIETITADKRRRLSRGAEAFLGFYEDLVSEATFDVVLVHVTNDEMKAERWEHAFDACR